MHKYYRYKQYQHFKSSNFCTQCYSFFFRREKRCTNQSTIENKGHVSVFYFNVRSLLPKIDNLRVICSVYKPCVVCLVETWLDSSIDDVEISIQGYTVVRLDHSRHGGGILIYVSTCLSHSIMFKGSPEFEFIVISLFNCNYTPQSPDFYLALFYRPPNSNISLLSATVASG